ncbi:hypothetical protein SDC9_143108 [bioreactor metagenome]|uniref:Uncharacterized protein n=1 Tax=bioreactor metagenome TaxID=1076179 RepID=A0A645E5W4_9ZZZZ
MSGHTGLTVMESPLRIEEVSDVRCLGLLQLPAPSIRMPDRKHDAVIQAILFEGSSITRLRRIGDQADQSAAQVLPPAHQGCIRQFDVLFRLRSLKYSRDERPF